MLHTRHFSFLKINVLHVDVTYCNRGSTTAVESSLAPILHVPTGWYNVKEK